MSDLSDEPKSPSTLPSFSKGGAGVVCKKDNPLKNRMLSPGFQKAVSRPAKGGILQARRRPFARRKTAFAETAAWHRANIRLPPRPQAVSARPSCGEMRAYLRLFYRLQEDY